MGWGIEFTAEIFLSKRNYQNNEYLVKEAIAELIEDRDKIKSQLNMFSSSNVRDIVPDDWKDQPIMWIHNNVSDLTNEFESIVTLIYQLNLYLEYLSKENQNEKAKLS